MSQVSKANLYTVYLVRGIEERLVKTTSSESEALEIAYQLRNSGKFIGNSIAIYRNNSWHATVAGTRAMRVG